MFSLILLTLAIGPTPLLGPSLSPGAPATYSGLWSAIPTWASDWGAAAAGISWDVACDAVPGNPTGGTLDGTGCVASKTGAPDYTTTYGIPARGAVTFAGSDGFTLSASGATQALRVRAVFAPSSVTGTQYILADDDRATHRAWALYLSGASLKWDVVTAGGTSSLTLGTVAIGVPQTAVAVYDGSGGEGHAILRGSLNGVAPTEVTTGHAPMVISGGSVTIGMDGTGASAWYSGSIADVGYSLSVATAAQVAVAVASQQARLATKPVGAQVSWTEGAGYACSSDASQCWSLPANTPLVESDGAWIGSATANSNLIAYSDPGNGVAPGTGWATGASVVAAPTVTTGQADVAGGASGSRVDMPAVSGAAAYSYCFPNSAIAAGNETWTWSCYARAVTGSPTFYMALQRADTARISSACALTATAWTRCSVTGAMIAGTSWVVVGVDLRDPTQTAQAAGSFYLSKCNLAATASPVPYRATAGTPLSGSPTAGAVAVEVTNPARWAIGVTATPAAGWAASNSGLWTLGASYGAANTAAAYIASGVIKVELYDASAGKRTWTADAALSGIAAKRIVVADVGGSLTVLADRSALSGTWSGTGTGLLSALPAGAPSRNLLLGRAGSSYLGGRITNVKQAATARGVR